MAQRERVKTASKNEPDPSKSSKIDEKLKNPRYFINEILKIHRERAKMRSKIEKTLKIANTHRERSKTVHFSKNPVPESEKCSKSRISTKNHENRSRKIQMAWRERVKTASKNEPDPSKSSKIYEKLKNPRYFINEILKIHRERAKMRPKIEKHRKIANTHRERSKNCSFFEKSCT